MKWRVWCGHHLAVPHHDRRARPHGGLFRSPPDIGAGRTSTVLDLPLDQNAGLPGRQSLRGIGLIPMRGLLVLEDRDFSPEQQLVVWLLVVGLRVHVDRLGKDRSKHPAWSPRRCGVGSIDGGTGVALKVRLPLIEPLLVFRAHGWIASRIGCGHMCDGSLPFPLP